MLHPESQLKAAVTSEVADDLVVVHPSARTLDLPSYPRPIRGETRMWVFPPVYFRAGVILSEYEVRVTISIDVGGGPAGLDVEPSIDRVERPAGPVSMIPDQPTADSTARDHNVVEAVFIDVEDQACRLLSRRTRDG